MSDDVKSKTFLDTVKEYWGAFRNRFRIDPLMKKRFERFGEIKKAKYALIFISILYVLSLVAELFISNRPIMMWVDGKLYFPTYSKTLLAEDFGFRVENELELNYREFKNILRPKKEAGFSFL